MTPLDYYRDQCNQGRITEDHQQLHALHHLQRIYIALLHEHERRSGFLSALRKPELVHGAYLWGSVGIGKTFLLDCLYRTLPFQNKCRMHFHAFMQMVHRELKKHQGKKDPLKFIARDFSRKYLLICFDELIVNDIADAMLLGRLFRLLFSHGVSLVTTSNSMPEDLYKKGLQRKSFLPAIALLKQHTEIIHLSGEMDYRASYFKKAGVFYIPDDDAAKYNMEKSFSLVTNDQEFDTEPAAICGRYVSVIKKTDDVIWFDFEKICSVPRSQQDYLAIAEKYKTVFISNVTVIPEHANDKINLFIRMIDVFYDAHLCLILSSAIPIADIYRAGLMTAEFRRTHSRLQEMQSESWLAKT